MNSRTPALLAAAIAAVFSAHSGAADWPQFGFDAAHTGNNTAETSVGPANVAQLVPVYAGPVQLPADVDSAPVYASGIATSGGTRNLLFAFGTSSMFDGGSSMGTLMAIDAATGATVWSKSTVGSSQHASASPAIDPSRDYVYSFGVDGYIHKYAIGDGTEVQTGGPTGWPQQITLKPDVEKVASGLTIAASGGTHYLIAVTDGYNGDGGDYQGHIVSIDLASGARKVFNAMCSDVTTLLAEGGCPGGRMSGIWGRGGAMFDAATNRIYIATGNGHFDPGQHQWGDSVVALGVDGSGGAAGQPKDSYTPSNYQSLENGDTDLGSISPALLKAPAGSSVAHIGVQSGKDAKLRLFDLDDMSGSGAPGNAGGELQLIDVPNGAGGMNDQPATWIDGAGSSWLFTAARNGGIAGLKVGLSGSTPALSQVWHVAAGSTSPVVANGVLYSFSHCGGSTCLAARNPATGDILWSQNGVSGPHWQSPIFVDGTLYAIDGDGKLWAFHAPAGDTIFESGFDG